MNPYSGTSVLAKSLRVGAAGLGLVYGSITLALYKSKAAKAQASKAAHH